MGRIPAVRLLEKVPVGASVLLRGVNGRPKGSVSSRELAELVAIEAVEGVGTPNRLKYVQMLVDDRAVVERSVKLSRQVRRERGRSRLESLLRMVSDRKTVRRDRLFTLDELGMKQFSGLFVWEHKPTGHGGAYGH